VSGGERLEGGGSTKESRREVLRTILLSDAPREAELLAALLDPRFSVDAVSSATLETNLASTPDYDIAIGAAFPEPWLRAATRLRHLVVPFAGVPRKLRDILGAAPQISVYSSHYNAGFVAEHAWALLLAAAKRIVPADRALRAGDWSARHNGAPSRVLRGKTLLLLGYGEIGREVARMAKGFDMRVIAIRRTTGTEGTAGGDGAEGTVESAGGATSAGAASAPAIDRLGGPGDLLEFLGQADAIIAALPETARTIGLLGREAFARMRPGVLLVNVGRGSLIDEDSFAAALRSGKIGAAGIDAWWVYPENEAARSATAPSKHALGECENLVFSPHRASDVVGHDEAQLADVARILRAIAVGSPPRSVDRSEWS